MLFKQPDPDVIGEFGDTATDGTVRERKRVCCKPDRAQPRCCLERSQSCSSQGMSERSIGDKLSLVCRRNYRFSSLHEVLSIDACAPIFNPTPPLALTMGDASGIGPEIVAKVLAKGGERVVVFGSHVVMQDIVRRAGLNIEVRRIQAPDAAQSHPR